MGKGEFRLPTTSQAVTDLRISGLSCWLVGIRIRTKAVGSPQWTSLARLVRLRPGGKARVWGEDSSALGTLDLWIFIGPSGGAEFLCQLIDRTDGSPDFEVGLV